MELQVLVGGPSSGTASQPDSAKPTMLGGKSGEGMVAELHHPSYTQAFRQRMFRAATAAAGVVLPTAASTAPVFGLWNPASSNVNLVLVRFKAGYLGTTGVAGNVLYANVFNAGNALGTAAPLSAFTAAVLGTSVFPAVLGAGAAPVGRATVAGTNTLTTAGTIVGTSGFSQLATTAATTGAGMWQLQDEFKGEMIIGPGNFWYPVGSAAIAATWNLELSWYEVTLP